MAETQTPNYKWIKPDIGGDASNWGNVLNATTDAIDSVVYANQQAGVPIGSITMFGGATAPTNWVLCQGQSVATTGTYAALYAVLGYKFGGSGANFNLPNFTDIFPIGASTTRVLGATGGLATVTLDATMIPAHTHTATQPTHTHTASQGTHTHPITDVAHNHGVNQWAHSHNIVTGNHAHGIVTGSHAHSGVVTGLQGGQPGGPIAGGAGGNLITGNTSTAGNLGGNTDTAGNLGGYTDTQTSAVSLNASGTGLSTTQAASGGAVTVSTVSAGAITVAANTGGGAAHNNMPPWLGINFIIRFQ